MSEENENGGYTSPKELAIVGIVFLMALATLSIIVQVGWWVLVVVGQNVSAFFETNRFLLETINANAILFLCSIPLALAVLIGGGVIFINEGIRELQIQLTRGQRVVRVCGSVLLLLVAMGLVASIPLYPYPTETIVARYNYDAKVVVVTFRDLYNSSRYFYDIKLYPSEYFTLGAAYGTGWFNSTATIQTFTWDFSRYDRQFNRLFVRLSFIQDVPGGSVKAGLVRAEVWVNI